MTTRIYVVCFGEATRLVRAATKSQAVRHVADSLIAASVATQDDLITALGKGTKVEDANEEGGEADSKPAMARAGDTTPPQPEPVAVPAGAEPEIPKYLRDKRASKEPAQ